MKRYRVTRIGSFLSEKAHAAGMGDVRVLANAAGVDGPTLRRLCLGHAAALATVAKLAAALSLDDQDTIRLMMLARVICDAPTVEAVEIMGAVAKAGSQDALARLAGVRPTTISEAINGVRVPRPSTMRKIREAVAA